MSNLHVSLTNAALCPVVLLPSLNELILGAVTTTSGRPLHNLITLSEKLSFLSFVQSR